MANSNKSVFGRKNIDIETILFAILKRWKLFTITLIVIVGFAMVYIKYVSPQYLVNSKMIISLTRNNKIRNPNDLVDIELEQPRKILLNEIMILQSFPIIEKVIKDLGFYVSYYYKEDFIPYRYFPFKEFPNLVLREMYGDVPFEVQIDLTHPQPVDKTFYIKILNQNEYALKLNASKINIYDYQNDRIVKEDIPLLIQGQYKFGELVQGSDYSFRIFLNSKYSDTYNDKDLYFSFNNIFNLTRVIQDKLKVEPSSWASTSVLISFEWKNVEKAIKFVNGLMHEYIQRDLDRKNYLALSTIEYIDQQLSNISSSLNMTEGELQNFRRQNRFLDLDQKSIQVSQQLQNLESQKQTLEQQLRFYNELLNYFVENKDSPTLLAPASMGVEDAVLNSMIQQLATLNSEKNTLIDKKLQRSSRYKTLETQIEDLKTSISKNIKFYISSTDGALAEVNTNIRNYKYEQQKLPQTQRQLLGIERKFNLNNEIYNFLLQKQAEAQITRASNLPDSEIIEPAIYGGVTSPNKLLVLILALFFGFGTPFTYVIFNLYLNEKIVGQDEIKSLTKNPLIGTIIHNKHNSYQVIKDFPRDIVSESIRSLRTNLQFILKGARHPVIVITSTFSGEGKSFTALNMATSMALMNKKTILINFDLRKPGILYKIYNTDTDPGLSNYLISDDGIDKYIKKTSVENLDVILSGDFPPNPAELIESERTEMLLTKLKSNYDYIFVDTPPVGPVTDAYMLMEYADATIFIVRHNHTLRVPFYNAITEIEDKGIKNLCVVLNDVIPDKRTHGYRYSDAYYKYSEKKGFFRRLLPVRKASLR